jgi:ankyrin repeat protein
MTALMLALGEKDLEKTKLLIQHGADLELTDDFNATALRHAVEADCVSTKTTSSTRRRWRTG